MAPVVLFRCDASPAIGAGHFMRCNAMAEAFRRKGWRAVFVVNEEALSYIPASLLMTTETRVASQDVRAQLPSLMNDIGRPALVVVDSYALDHSYEAVFGEFGIKVMAIDDRPTRRHDCDWLLDTGETLTSTRYDDLVPPRCKRLFGASYVSIRSEIRGSKWVPGNEDATSNSLFVSFGASNVGGGIELALQAASRLKPVPKVTVATSSSNAVALEAQFAGSIDVMLDRSDIGPALANSSVGVGAGGVAAWERCYVGLPSVFFTTAENQMSIASTIAAAGAATYLGDIKGGTVDKLTSAIGLLLANSNKRNAMSKSGQALIDGLGGERLVDMVAA